MKFRHGFEWLNQYASGWQFGEEGVIEALALRFIGKDGSFCEFGAGTSCSCAALIRRKWHGLIYESDKAICDALTPILKETSVNIINSKIEVAGENSLDSRFARDVITPFFRPDILVIDVDSIDYHIWASLQSTPKLVMIEHHDLYDTKRDELPDVPNIETCGSGHFKLQATAKAIKELGKSKGYSLVASSRVNSIFIRNDLMPKGAPIIGIMSLPQLGHNTTWGCISEAFFKCELQPPIQSGMPAGWWERGIQTNLSHAIEDGSEIAICLDYDSVFTAFDLMNLIDVFKAHPEIDALAGLQPRRNDGEQMLSPVDEAQARQAFRDSGNEKGPWYEKQVKAHEPLEVTTAHFGLTAIRLARLKDIPKPWFLNVAGKDGEWDSDSDGRVDADIFCWNKWREHGRNIYVLPGVRVGHLEQLVAMVDPDGITRHRYYHQWKARSSAHVIVDKDSDKCQRAS